MGTWGTGIFDNDRARDHLFELTQSLGDAIEEALDTATKCTLSGATSPESLEVPDILVVVLPNIEIICVLHETLDGGYLPEPAIVDKWKTRFGQLSMHAISAGNSISERQEIIDITFAKLRRLAELCWDE